MSKPPLRKVGDWVSARLVAARQRTHSLPTDSEIYKAVRHLRVREPYCRMEGLTGNEGFGISLSFEPVTYQSGADFIEVALRRASLRFTPSGEAGWRWADALKDFIGRAVETYTIKRTTGTSGTRSAEMGARAEVYAEGEIGVPVLKAKGGTKLGVDAKGSASSTTASGVEIARTVTERWGQITRPDGEFELKLDSPPHEDLVRMNTDLDRIGVLACDEPGQISAEDVRVTLTMRHKDEGEHALRIRDAGGAWRRLTEHRNKAVISEIYISKFLKPAHQPLKLWPPRKRS